MDFREWSQLMPGGDILRGYEKKFGLYRGGRGGYKIFLYN